MEAPANPDYNYVAIDIKNEMLVLAKRKLEAAYAEKIFPWTTSAFALTLCISPPVSAETDRIDRIYINFCNPWPRGKHKKRRLTHPRQLVQYRQILDGEIWFKTDDAGLFEDSLQYFPQAGFRIRTMTRDLHKEPALCYFETEHEKMFTEMGKPIHFLIAEPDPDVPAEALQEWMNTYERNG